MQRIFIPWWILILTAGLFFGLALAGALDGAWIQVVVWLAFAAFSVWLGLIHRRRLKDWEKTHESQP